MAKKQLVAEALIDLHRRLRVLPSHTHEPSDDHAGDRSSNVAPSNSNRFIY